MGTIGDLLGIDLASAFAQENSDVTNIDGTQGDASIVSPAARDTAVQLEPGKADKNVDVEAVNPRHEAVLAAIVAETNLEPSQARLELTLRGDLDLDALALYAIVAAIEHELRCSFVDEDVRSWQTLGDILNAADEVGKTAQTQH